jgi:hypothetical protein
MRRTIRITITGEIPEDQLPGAGQIVGIMAEATARTLRDSGLLVSGTITGLRPAPPRSSPGGRQTWRGTLAKARNRSQAALEASRGP